MAILLGALARGPSRDRALQARPVNREARGQARERPSFARRRSRSRSRNPTTVSARWCASALERSEPAPSTSTSTLSLTIATSETRQRFSTSASRVPSEVDEFWRLFRERALPRVAGQGRCHRRAPTIRASGDPSSAGMKAIEDELGANADVRVLSAYKQGYSWLYDVVRPALAGTSVSAITIRFARYDPPEEWRQQAMGTPLRWLHEAFPHRRNPRTRARSWNRSDSLRSRVVRPFITPRRMK